MARPIEKREHIERGVVAVIAEKGLRGTTIQDIADAAKVSPGLLYRYWKNRDDLAQDVYCEHYTAMAGRFSALAEAEPDVWGKLHVLVRAFLRHADEQPTLVKFLLFGLHELGGRVPGEQSARALLRGVLAEGIAAGRLREMSVDLACELVLGVVIQPVIGAFYGHVSTPISDRFDDIYAALERVLGPAHPVAVTVAARRPEAAALRTPRQSTPPTRAARR